MLQKQSRPKIVWKADIPPLLLFLASTPKNEADTHTMRHLGAGSSPPLHTDHCCAKDVSSPGHFVYPEYYAAFHLSQTSELGMTSHAS